jgi:hypothetical protein
MIKSTQNMFLAGIVALAITGCSGAEDEKPALPPDTAAEEADRQAHALAELTMRPFDFEVKPSQSVEPDRVFLVEWVYQGESLEEVVDTAALIVRGSVISQRSVISINPVWDSEKGRYQTLEETGPRDVKFELPETISTIQIDEVLSASDTSVKSGGTIEIRELGGFFSNGTYGAVTDKPVLVLGQKAIFMLNAPDAKAAYREAGGTQGRFMIEDGTVRALHEGFRSAYDGRTVTQMASEITRLRADR